MLDPLLGFILLGLGLRHTAIQPNVLGDEVVTQEIHTTVTPLPTLRVLVPVLTKDQEDAFQSERQIRETNIKHVSDSRTNELEKSFRAAKHRREQEDEVPHAAFVRKVNTFSSNEKKQKILAIGDTFQSVITNALTSMQKKLESMLTLLDKISVAAAAIQKQGKDISSLDSHIRAAQAKVTRALTLAKTLAGSLSTALTVTSETTAPQDLRIAISDAKTKLVPLYTAFTEARKAVGVAVEDLELLTKAVDVTPTP